MPPLCNTHPHHDYLQNRLNTLKERIHQKRKSAKVLFEDILHKLQIEDLSNNVPQAVEEQLSYIKNVLLITNPNQDVEFIDVDALCSKLAIEDILQAIQALSTPEGGKSQLLATKLAEELKKILSAKLSMRQDILSTTQWQRHVNASTLTQLLSSESNVDVANQFGGPEAMLDKALNLANNFANIIGKVPQEEYQNAIHNEHTPQATIAQNNDIAR